MIENFITQYQIPEGLALNYVIDGKEYLIPMVTEEPSVIAVPPVMEPRSSSEAEVLQVN